jgi:hypothetical protein
MTISRKGKFAAAALTATALIFNAAAASAQPYPPPPPPGNGPPPGEYGPPPGQYGPPPGPPVYDDRTAQADAAYAARYQAWYGRYCVQREHNNVAAGAIIGGALGAILGAGISHGHAGGTIVGGALGATTGAAIASDSNVGGGCPPGYVIRAGAPAFYWGGPVVYAPPGYNPWVFVDGRYTYVPYRVWYWRHHGWRGY